jgi:hypothetical protein
MLWVKVLLFIKRLFTFFATPWSTNCSWAIRGQLSLALGPALPSTRIQSPLYSYMFSLSVPFRIYMLEEILLFRK